ncbi:MAG: cell shape-determining protein, partial [Eudoraea sp.]|nr:cell shape-determining protein [Eudoraea sp.]
NADINSYAIKKLSEEFGENGSFRLVSPEELNDPERMPEEGLFSKTDDFIKMTEAVLKYPAIHELPLKNNEQLAQLMGKAQTDDEVIPLFVKYPDGNLEIIASVKDKVTSIPEGSKLVYLGKIFDIEEELV